MQFFYLKHKVVLINVLLLCAIIIAIVGKTDTTRSLSAGFAVGICIIELGEGISHLREKRLKNGRE